MKNLSGIRAIAALSRRYEAEFLCVSAKRRKEYVSDWYSALEFFLSHVFFQGRRDSLSQKYFEATLVVLGDFFSSDRKARARRFDEAWRSRMVPHDSGSSPAPRGNPLLDALTAGKAGKARDREMVLDALCFIRALPDWNVVAYSIGEIRGGRIAQHFEALMGIRQVGPKVAAFYLRDLCTLYQLAPSPETFLATQPIDTWVRNVSVRLGIFARDDSEALARSKILAACQSAAVSPGDYNAGAWYLGTHSLQIALEQLGGEEVSQ